MTLTRSAAGNDAKHSVSCFSSDHGMRAVTHHVYLDTQEHSAAGVEYPRCVPPVPGVRRYERSARVNLGEGCGGASAAIGMMSGTAEEVQERCVL